MKYSSNFSSITYESTIGNFEIIDFTSFFVLPTNKYLETVNYSIDKSTTLIEASNSIYSDPDSMWLFLIANHAVNPFTLAKNNSSSENEKFSSLDTVNLTTIGTDYYLFPGSIVGASANTGGSAWSFSSTGYFSLTGPFALVDSVNSFSKRITLKSPVGSMIYENATRLATIEKTSTGYVSYNIQDNNYRPSVVGGSFKKNIVTKQIEYKDSLDNKYTDLKSELPVIAKGSGSAYTPSGFSAAETFTQVASNEDINILAYNPKNIRFSSFVKITQNYKV
jgi:hypothetical protein